MIGKQVLACGLAAAVACSAAPTAAQNYNYTFTTADGSVISSGGLSVDDSHVNTLPDGGTGRTITSLTGSFLGQSIALVSSPHPPEVFTAGPYIGNNQLRDGPYLLDGYGLIFRTSSGVYGNMLGDAGFTGGYAVLFGNDSPNDFYEGSLTLSEAFGSIDAPGGSTDAPTALPSGLISSITGAVGPEALEQYYSFQWGGGLFSATASITDAASTDLFSFMLLGSGGPFSATLDQANYFTDTLSLDLAAGNYAIGISSLVTIDPPFTIRFDRPVGLAAVPEPGSWALMILGLGAVGSALRRRRARTSVGFA